MTDKIDAQTKLELLKIAAQLTNTTNSYNIDAVKDCFENLAFYLCQNFEKLGTVQKINSD